MAKFAPRGIRTGGREDFAETYSRPAPLVGQACADCGHDRSEHSSDGLCLHFNAAERPPVCQCNAWVKA
jgi:hypothetical protein